MSSPNHLTTDIEDAFSSNFLDYTTASPNYFLASPGNISPDPLDNLSKYLLASLANSPFHDMQAYNVIANKPAIPPQDPITPPTILTPSSVLPPSLLFDPRYFFVPEEFLPPKKQIHAPSSSSTMLSNSFQKKKAVKIRFRSSSLGVYKMPPKRTSTSEASAITHAAIRKLVTDTVAIALEAQAAMMASTNNPDRNFGPRKTLVARNCTYEKFMSCQPFYFNAYWSKEAYKITWSKYKRLLIKKYCPQTEIKKMEEAITMTYKLIEHVMKHNSVQETNNHKRKLEDRRNTTNGNNNNYHNNNRNNDHHQQQNKNQETFSSYTATNGDWLSKYHAKILYEKKAIHIPINGKTLIIRGRFFV
nr:hypothetical protein [Tanacetum cinerariifolium]